MGFLKVLIGLAAILLLANIPPSKLLADEAVAPAKISAEEKQIRQDLETWMKSVMDADEKTFFEFAHPRPFERRIGLKEETARQMKAGKEAFAKMEEFIRGKFDLQIEFPQPAIFIKSSVHEFAIVPCVIIVDTKVVLSKTHTFQLGVREIGEKKWKYLDGTKLDQGDIRDYFEDFSKEQPLPLVKTESEQTAKGEDLRKLLNLPPLPRLPM